MQIVFLHGLETGPHGAKYHVLRQAFPELLAPDCTGVFDIERRLELIEQSLTGHTDLLLVGSSFGGLAAVLFASRHPALVAGTVLCAPAVHVIDLASIHSLPAEIVILHGSRDEIVPLEANKALAARFPSARLITVDDDHRLGGSHELLVREVGEMMRRIGQ
jgi:pimeloyl-ACP methyl ester carboxylesterase